MLKVSAETEAMKVRSRIAWGATLGGILVAMTMFMVIGSFAAALTGSFEATDAGGGTPIWLFALTVASMFAGGYSSTYLSDGERMSEAFLQGIILWGATALLLIYLLMNGINLVGAETLLGFPEGSLSPLSAASAWWAFIGVILTLLASILGSVTACMRLTRTRDRLHGHPLARQLEMDAERRPAQPV